MKSSFNRRAFLISSAAVGAGLAVAGRLSGAERKTKLHKALIGTPSEDTFKKWKAAGFEGVESRAWKVPPAMAEAGRKLAEKHGMKIHSVLYGWANFNHPDKFESDLASVASALNVAQGYGAGALLLVPCRIGGMPMPEPWEFDVAFDEKTNHLQRVVPGDNAKYAKYIEAHNRAVDASRAAVKKLIPTAEKAGVVIALENVWNNLWVQPALFANFVASFDNPWVQAYFDVGNHVKYAPPQQWIRTLDKLIVRCHVKDFKLNPDGHGGDFVCIRDGSVDWPRVRKELDAVGYNGWMTIEGSRGLSLKEQSTRLDQILAGV